MDDIEIRIARRTDVARLDAALNRLSEDLGDAHAASVADLERFGFGVAPAFQALLAERGEETLGCAVYSPVFSTIRAAPGLYVSDLWISREARGLGLGRRLLGAAARAAEAAWGARFLKLTVYDDNHPAQAFYDRLGFHRDARETPLTLDAAGFDSLKGSE